MPFKFPETFESLLLNISKLLPGVLEPKFMDKAAGFTGLLFPSLGLFANPALGSLVFIPGEPLSLFAFVAL